MSYTSTLGLALTANACETLRASVAALEKDTRKLVQAMLRHADARVTRRGARCYFWNSVLWSPGDAERVFLEGLVQALDPADYHLCRAGDDAADNEDRGSFEDPFDLRLRRDVTLG